MNDHIRTTALLEAATDDLDTDVAGLVAGAVGRGRALRRRRRLGTTLASVAVVGVIGAGASVIELPAEPTTTHFYVSPATPTTLPSEAARRFSMDPTKTAWVLSDLLPPGEVSHRVSGSDQVDSERYRDGRLLFNGGMVSVRGEWVDDRDDEVCADLGCEDLGNGDRLLVSPSSPMSKDGTRLTSSVVVYYADGWAIGVSASNFPETPDDEPIADRPVLTIGQLKAIALSDVWLDDPQ